jgi:hypothetical protein
MNRLVLLSLAGAGLVANCAAAQLYDCTLPNPPVAFSNFDENVVMMDDVMVPLNRLNGESSVAITQFQVKMFVPISGTYRVTTWISKARITGGQLQPEFPLTQLTSQNYNFPTGNTINSITVVPTGGPTVATLPWLPFNFEGNDYGVFFIGMSFSAPLQNIGWIVADGLDTNLDGFYAYYGAGDARNGVKLLDGYRASFSIKVQGMGVPEPGTWLALGCGLAFVVRRRSKRTAS